MRQRYIPALDGMRAYAVLAVITVHVKTAMWGWVNGALGVTIFFVLSGYLITSLLVQEEGDSGRVNLPAFFIRRIFRLFPAYYVVLGIYAALILGLGVDAAKAPALKTAMPWYLLYMQEHPFIISMYAPHWPWMEGLLPFGQSWSLGVEEKFYLVWPLLAFALLRRRPGPRLGMCLAAAAVLTFTPLAGFAGYYLGPYAPIFVGCAMALLLTDKRWAPRFRWLQSGRAAFGLVVLLLLAQFASSHSFVVQALFPVVCALLVGSVATGDSRVSRALSWKPLVFIGTVSYGVYLVHLLGQGLVLRMLPSLEGPGVLRGLTLTIVVSAVAVGSAWILGLTVEHPMRRLGRRLAHHLGESGRAPEGIVVEARSPSM